MKRTICFFPWIKVETVVALPDGSALVPFQRSQEPFGIKNGLQRAADALLLPYRTRFNQPIDEAVIFARDPQDVIAEIDAFGLQQTHIMSEFLAFDALARRRFFSYPQAYCSRGHFRVIAQMFDPEDPTFVATDTRRRDGRCLTAWSVDELHDQIPANLGSQYHYVIDEPLVQALWANRSDLDLLDAIACFNQGNTDSTDFPAAAEITLLVSAIERIVRSKSGDARSFKQGFLELAELVPSIPCSEFPKGRRESFERNRRRAGTIVEAWLDDLYALRGNVAHGRNPNRYPALWTIEEHLLLSTFVFPLLVSRRLASSESPGMRQCDADGLNALEHLLKHENVLVPSVNKYGQRQFCWNDLLAIPGDMRMKEKFAQLIAEAEDTTVIETEAG